jgi:hypothetical protein
MRASPRRGFPFDVDRLAAAILIGLGVAARVWALALNNQLSIDEAALARNLTSRSWAGLLRPLDFAQLAPPGFLLVEKGLLSTFGDSEYALRLFPLLCSLLAVVLSWTVARHVLNRFSALLALGLIGFNVALIEYAARAKPYACDVAATLLILWLTICLFRPATSRLEALGLGLAGAATVLFSFAAVFSLSGAAIALAVMRDRQDRSSRSVRLVAAGCLFAAAGIGVAIGRALLSGSDAAYMQWFWRFGFLPRHTGLIGGVAWVWRQLLGIFRWTAMYRASVGWGGLLLLGVWSLRRDPLRWLLLVSPLVLVTFAAATHNYPLASGRVDLFLQPVLLMIVAEACGSFGAWLPSRMRRLAVVPAGIVVALAIQAVWIGFPRPERSNLRAAMTFVHERRQPGEPIYVHHFAAMIFSYYAPQLGFDPREYQIGSCSSESVRPPLQELDRYRGHARVWVVTPLFDGDDPFERYLGVIGARVERGDSPDAEIRRRVGLYDLSTSRDIDSSDAFALPAKSDPVWDGWGCYGVLNVNASSSAL